MSNFDEVFDFVVVGSGAGSMSSALVMRKAGKSIVILEKSPFVGGTTAKSGGVIWVPNNRFLTAEEKDESAEKGITYLDAVAEDLPGTSHEKRLAYVTNAAKMIDFLVEEGVALERASHFWPDYYDELPGGCKTSRCVVAVPFNKKELGPEWAPKLRKGFLEVKARLDDCMQLNFMKRTFESKNLTHKQSWKIRKIFLSIAFGIVGGILTGKKYVTAGAALQGRMLKAVLKAGADVRTETPVKELIVEDGKVTGVVIEKNGKPVRIGAKLGVLVNAGGFAQNQAMRDKYMPGTQAAWSNAIETDMGDMHVELERIGGVLAQMDQMVGFQTTRAPGFETDFVKPGMQAVTGRPGAILVDQSGVRYMNEGGSYELYCQTLLERNKVVPALPSWAIFDQRYADNYQVAGKWVGKEKKPKDFVESGYLKQADTIEELAQLLKIDPATLKATVERWNGFVDKGVDEDFHRGERAYDQWLGDPFHNPNRSLGRIDQGPFYAVEVIPGDVSTYGGVVTDVHGRVTRADGSVIEGLYACGVTTASMMGGVYPGAGASIGPSMAYGYIAARHAAGIDNQA